MTKLEVEIHDDVITTINKARSINDHGIEIVIPKGSVLFENILNLKLIQHRLDKAGILVHFSTEDDIGSTLIDMLEDGKPGSMESESVSTTPEPRKLRKLNIPHISLKLPKIKLPKGKPILLIPVILGIALLLMLTTRLTKATVKIVVNSQPLTRSVTIRVSSTAQTDLGKAILHGTTLTAGVEDTLEIDTTGTKLIGDKAEGSATIYNNTDSDKEFKEGTVLLSDDLKFVTLADITVPKRTAMDEDPENPGISTYQKGEITVEVRADAIGDDYNLDSGKELKVKDYDKSEFVAKVKDDIEGGSSETVQVVSADDLKNASAQLTTKATEAAKDTLKDKVDKKQTLIAGSEKITLVKEAFDHKVEDETERLSVTQTLSGEGLVYLNSDLDTLLDKLVADLIPEGFVLSDKERGISIEVLGNSTNSVLTNQEADIQVTLKTYVVPDIQEAGVLDGISGKSFTEAQKYLGSIRNIKSYELRISPGIPLLQRVPKDKDRIDLTIERE